jgi:hypothetical protein
MENSIQNTNILPNLKTPVVFYPIMFFILALIIIMFLIFFKVPFSTSSSKSDQQVTANVLIATSFVLILFFLCIGLLPNLKSLKGLFEQISNVSYVILYTIGLILFFTFSSKDFINSQAKYITPITIGLGLLAFYKSLQKDYITDFNSNYERIKTVILMFSLITCYIIYYNKDPGGYISKYFGYTLLLTIIIAVFGFLYLITLLTLPEYGSSDKTANFLSNFSNFSVYGSLLFLLFLVGMTILITTYPGGFLNDKISAPVIILLLLVSIIWSVLLIGYTFPELSDKTGTSSKMNLFKRALLVLFGTVISGLVIFWIVYNIQNLSGQSSIVSFILNILLVLIVLAFIYKIINVNLPVGNTKKNGFFNLIFNFLFYIPCIFSGVFDKLGSIFANEFNASNMGSILMLLFAILLLVIYVTTPLVFNKVSSQGGQQLVNKPVNTDSLYSLGTYEELNGKHEFDYQFAISSWIYLDAAGPNTNASYKTYTSLLNFGNKPNIMYNGTENTIIITTEQKNLESTTENKLTDMHDNGNQIIYKNTNIPLQKWNHFIINYNGGIMDIFLNGELVKSVPGVVPYYTLDNLTIGEKNGIKGGICNVVYFRNALTRSNIYYLYNTVKNKTPPITSGSNETIIQNNLKPVETIF